MTGGENPPVIFHRLSFKPLAVIAAYALNLLSMFVKRLFFLAAVFL